MPRKEPLPTPVPASAAADDDSPSKVDKVAVATKHPGVFVETSELEAETGKKLPVGIELREVTGNLDKGRKRRAGTKRTSSAEAAAAETKSQDDKAEKDNLTENANEKELKIEPTPDVEMSNLGEVEVSANAAASTEEAMDVEVKTEVDATEEKKKAGGKEDKAASSTTTTTTTESAEQGESRVTRRSARNLVKDEAKRKAAASPTTVVKTEDKDESADIQGSVVPAASAATEGETSEAESECSEATNKDNESVASSSTLTTRSSSRNKKDAPGEGGGASGGGGGMPGVSSSSKAASSEGGKKNGKGKASRAKAGGFSAKGKSRRHIFKKSAARAPAAVARTVTSDRVYYNGQFYTRGDIVSVTDVDGGIYYAQLRGFMTDQYCEKSGVITWLLPTEGAPPPEDGFDASRYVVGPEEELPRRLGFFTFVMHAPDDYFYHRTAPYPTKSHPADQEYVLTRAGPKVRLVKHNRVVYQDACKFY